MALTPETDLFGESAEQIEADKARWQEQFSASRELLRRMAHEAREDYQAGRTAPIRFATDGRIIREVPDTF